MKEVWDKTTETMRYWDDNGVELQEGDVVMVNGQSEKLCRLEGGFLGRDATNPLWIEKGKACVGEYGYYHLSVLDEVIKIQGD